MYKVQLTDTNGKTTTTSVRTIARIVVQKIKESQFRQKKYLSGDEFALYQLIFDAFEEAKEEQEDSVS